MLQHETIHWEIVNNPNVVGERIRIAKRSSNGHSEPAKPSCALPGTILFPAHPKSVPVKPPT